MKSIQEELVKWLERRPLWWRLPLRKLLRSEEITQEDIAEFSKIALLETQGQWKQKIEIDFREIISTEEEIAISIESISDMQNVNAIASGRSLDFGVNGVTVIYGDNGSGKSGYVRAIKVASGVAGAEPVKGNIYRQQRSAKDKPMCTVKLSSSQDLIKCDLSCTDQPSLKGITIFDTAIAMDYIGTSRGASYEPRIFGVLSELAVIVDQVNAHLTKQGASIDLSYPKIPQELIQAPVWTILKPLNHDSKLEDKFFEWHEEDDKRLHEYQQSIDEQDTYARLKQLKGQIEALESINSYLENLTSYFSDKHTTLATLRETWNEKSRQYKMLRNDFEHLADGYDKQDLNSDAWRNLWKYANDYAAELKNEIGRQKTCPLCRQSMEGSILERFNRMNDYVNSRLTQDMKKAEEDYLLVVRPDFRLLDDQTVISLILICDLWEDSLPYAEIIAAAGRKITQLQKSSLKQIEPNDLEFNQLVGLTDLKEMVERSAASLNSAKEQLERSQDEDEMARLKDELLNLKARKLCHENRKDFEDLIKRRREVIAIEKAEKTAKTNAITSMANLLAQTLLSQEYENSFNHELRALTDGKIKVRLKRAKAGKGRVPFKIQIEDVNGRDVPPNEILSEGEQRVVSLAAFIADSSMGNARGPLIFDDPISSLDYEFEGKTVKRLVHFAKTRQVIVFTHRLSLLHALWGNAGRQEVTFKDASLISSGTDTGIPSGSHLEKQRPIPSLNILLNEDIPRLRNLDVASSDHQSGLETLCTRFRRTVENCIEGILLCNITSRFQRDIRSRNVRKLKELKTEDCEMVDRMMTKYSGPLHSHSMETPFRIPSLGEIEQDIIEFKSWATEAQRRLLS